MKQYPEQWKKSAVEFVSGGLAGFIEVALLHPLDLVKTRLQLQTKPTKPSDPDHYNGIVDCFRKLRQTEGILSFWKGNLPPLIVETPTKSVRFTTFHYCKKIFSVGQQPNLLAYMGSGYIAGTVESFVVCPFEVVKVTLQADLSRATVAPSAWQMVKKIVQEEGIFTKRGIYRGLGATIHVHNIYCGIYLGLFYRLKDIFPVYEARIHNTLVTLGLGIATSSCACFFNIPFDVVKSRIQAPQPKNIKYHNTFQSIKVVYNEEGWKSLYKGLGAKLLRLGPGGAIVIFIFEFVDNYLSSMFLENQ
ncbi:hypothetical protein WA026_006396 [Henosepilachna vigintioctopunctata]|uniref:Mitochondrial 2-oxodicarboxylate carrier n=1 Tax=Henosepilachna vigintioctopunctata TaxID=420089 RepID=A0AAW1TK19_9CUCU